MHEAWEAFKAYVVDQKHKAIVHGKDLLQKADARIEELEGKVDKASGETKTEYQKEIKILKEKRANAGKKIDELESASADGWESAKEGFTRAYKDLYDAYKEAVEKL
jgi:predicted  nucleic acid-binding Zn-ribbon protein